MPDWTLDDSRHLYNVAHWGDGYFGVDDAGRACVAPCGDERRIALVEVIDRLRAHGVAPPVILRFTDLLAQRVDSLHAAFGEARARHDYAGAYSSVYPVKVNQQRTVIEHIQRPGDPAVGLEAGSKPELVAVMALGDPAAGPIICNGYKDREYVRLALIGTRMGLPMRIVIEQPSDVDLVLAAADAVGVDPVIGVRMRLTAVGSGHWQNTGGDRAKFGLTAQQVFAVVESLRARGRLDCLRLLHFHMGSQIANLRDIAAGMTEIARYYAELHRLGAPLDTVDVGGGLAIDYDGARSRDGFSMNYRLAQYADTVVATLARICADEDLPQPAMVTEAGRAMTAHHAVLVTDVIGTESSPAPAPADDVAPDATGPLAELERLRTDPPASMAERYQDALRAVADAHAAFTQGSLRLADWAQVERLFIAVARDTHARLRARPFRDPGVRAELTERLATKYFCNFSVFQSVPDVWGIGQHFPIMPLERLDEEPTVDAVLHDLTCDSDGQMGRYVQGDGVFATLPLHPVEPNAGAEYLIGIFLVGAYQEILGDRHNLFGDTHAVNVELTAEGWQVSDIEMGDRVDELLRYVHFDPEELLQRFRARLAERDLPQAEHEALLAAIEAGLSAYTYLQE